MVAIAFIARDALSQESQQFPAPYLICNREVSIESRYECKVKEITVKRGSALLFSSRHFDNERHFPYAEYSSTLLRFLLIGLSV